MHFFKDYIVTKRFKAKAICGNVNLPFGTKCWVRNGMICCDRGALCMVTSQNAFDYFTQNDDGCAKLRRGLIDSIFAALSSSNQELSSYEVKWGRVWNDSTCLKYKRKEYDAHWLWNYDFYHAEIDVLRFIAKLVDAKGVS